MGKRNILVSAIHGDFFSDWILETKLIIQTISRVWSHIGYNSQYLCGKYSIIKEVSLKIWRKNTWKKKNRKIDGKEIFYFRSWHWWFMYWKFSQGVLGWHLRGIQRWPALFQNSFRLVLTLVVTCKSLNGADSALKSAGNKNFQSWEASLHSADFVWNSAEHYWLLTKSTWWF